MSDVKSDDQELDFVISTQQGYGDSSFYLHIQIITGFYYRQFH